MNTDNSKEDNNASVCANCGREGARNICNKCEVVEYCNAACKKVHKKKHKKDEEHVRLAAKSAAELHDEELFKQPPPTEDCPICFQRMPTLHTGSTYMSCCGKVICSGCIYAPLYDNQGNKVDKKKCAFCRTPFPKSAIEREKIRVEANDPVAIYNLGCDYRDGTSGFPQDFTKALELYHRSAKLGHAMAYNNIGYAYEYGEGVEHDMKKANHYYELGAMKGSVFARHNLGVKEEKAGNMSRALKHHMIAVEAGDNDSLKKIQKLYKKGYATEDDYTKALRLYQEYLGEIKSAQRDEAAAFNSKKYRYY